MAPSQQTWRVLGLAVATGYAGLGTFASLFPLQAADLYWAIRSSSSSTAKTAMDKHTRSSISTSPTAADVALLMRLLGARDLSIALAMALLAREGQWRAVGIVDLAGVLLYAADVGAIWDRRGPVL